MSTPRGDEHGLDGYLVVGGEGFLGHTLLEDLHKRYGRNVKLFSSSRTQRYPSDSWTWIKCDLTSVDSIRGVLEQTQAQTVFLPAASHFESSRADAWAVNVEGVRTVVAACLKAGVRRLVLTSSTAIYFDGSDLIDVKEDRPAITEEQHKSFYGASKAEGERIVMEANGQQGLYTCAIRCSSIIGDGDTTVIPQGMAPMLHGQGCFQIGDNKNKHDFDHVLNVTRGHILACEKLLDPADSSKPGVAAGEAFNITADEPIEFWTFFRRVWYQYNGYKQPFTFVMPFWLAWIFAAFFETFMKLMGKKPEGFTRFAIIYATAWRWHNIDKAKKLLGFEPVIGLDEGIRLAVQAYKDNEERERLQKDSRKSR